MARWRSGAARHVCVRSDPGLAALRERLRQRAAEEATTPIAVANRPEATTTFVIAHTA
jgi:hypothetical protein